MAKTIYRICLIVCLAIAIGAGLFLFDRYQEEQKEDEEWTLVRTEREVPAEEAMTWQHHVIRFI